MKEMTNFERHSGVGKFLFKNSITSEDNSKFQTIRELC